MLVSPEANIIDLRKKTVVSFNVRECLIEVHLLWNKGEPLYVVPVINRLAECERIVHAVMVYPETSMIQSIYRATEDRNKEMFNIWFAVISEKWTKQATPMIGYDHKESRPYIRLYVPNT